jgi:uncharacterized protein (TIGR03083 family)
MDETALYRRAKQRMVDIVRSMSDVELAAVCPACPAWSIRDVVAHHVHVVGAVADGTFPPEASEGFVAVDAERRAAAAVVRDGWTEAGVRARRSVPFGDVLDEWKGVAKRMGPNVLVGLFDVIVHLGDVVEAVGDRRGVDTELAEYAMHTCYERALAGRLVALGEMVVLHCADTGVRIGTYPNAAEVRGTTNELLRTLAGRRTRVEADAALDWGTASGEARELFPVYGWPT